jgi:hypothetical protein
MLLEVLGHLLPTYTGEDPKKTSLDILQSTASFKKQNYLARSTRLATLLLALSILLKELQEGGRPMTT